MKKVISTLLAGAISLTMAVPAFASAEESEKIYVSPTGDDGSMGITMSNPVKTPQRAQELARGKEDGKKIEVIFAKGEYLLDDTLAFTEEDSGTAAAPVVYRAYQGADVKFTVAKKVENFEDYQGNIKVADLSAVEGLTLKGDMTDVVYQGGEMQEIAGGTLTTDDYVINAELGEAYISTARSYLLKQTGVKKGTWSTSYSYVLSDLVYYQNNPDDSNVLTDKDGNVLDATTVPTGDIFNSFGDLDEAGEYYVDATAGKLYYYPKYDVAEEAVYIAGGDAKATISVTGAEYIAFEGIDLFCGAGYGFNIKDSDNVTIYDSNIRGFAKQGVYAIEATNLLVAASSVADMQRGGIEICGEFESVHKRRGTASDDTFVPEAQYNLTSSGNVVRNCKIFDYDEVYKTAGAGVFAEGVGITVQNCEIYNSPYQAIYFSGNDHVIKNNKIYNVLQNVWDAGAIYSGRSWLSRGSVVSGNYIYNTKDVIDFGTVTSPLYYNKTANNAAVYLDDLQSGVTVDNNVVYNVSEGFLIGGGSDNAITNNVVIDCRAGFDYDNAGTNSGFRQQHINPERAYRGHIYFEMKAFIDNYYSDEAIKAKWDQYDGFADMVARVNAYVYTDNSTKNDAGNTIVDGSLDATEQAGLNTLGAVYNRTVENNVYTGAWVDWYLGESSPEGMSSYTPNEQLRMNAAADDSLTSYESPDANKLVATASSGYSVNENYEIVKDGTVITADAGVKTDSYTPSFSADEDGLNQGNSFTAVAAVYDASGTLKALETKKEVYVYDGQAAEIDVDLSAETDTTGWIVKILLWDSLTGLTPIANVGNPFAE